METQIFRQPDLAEIFERVLVPAVFQPYARDLVERARPFGPSDRALDLGCGTGIVARTLRDRLGGAAQIAGVDVSAPMIAKARSIAPDIAWHEGNASALPFADRSHDVVLSQQMLQFVPDRKAAVREIARVLTAGGRVAISTWRPLEHQPLYAALDAAAAKHLGRSSDKRWSLDGEELHGLLADAGFVDIRLHTHSLTDHFMEFPVKGSIMAASFDASALADATRAADAEADVQRALQRFAADGGYAATSSTNIAIARMS